MTWKCPECTEYADSNERNHASDCPYSMNIDCIIGEEGMAIPIREATIYRARYRESEGKSVIVLTLMDHEIYSCVAEIRIDGDDFLRMIMDGDARPCTYKINQNPQQFLDRT